MKYFFIPSLVLRYTFSIGFSHELSVAKPDDFILLYN